MLSACLCTWWTRVSLVLQVFLFFRFCALRVESLEQRDCISIKNEFCNFRKVLLDFHSAPYKRREARNREKMIMICLWFLPLLCILEEMAHLDEDISCKGQTSGRKKSTKFQPANIKERRKKSVEKDLKAWKKALFQIYLSFRLAWCTSCRVGVL